MREPLIKSGFVTDLVRKLTFLNMATSVERWMCDELSKLGLPASEDNAK